MFQRQGGVFYWQDSQTKQQGSLGTKDKRTAEKLLHPVSLMEEDTRTEILIWVRCLFGAIGFPETF
jgi:hypothetical protein